jgi:hypothetical protein
MKTVWRDLSTRARLGESFGWIEAVSLMHGQGLFADREAALEMLFRKATAEDIREYRKIKGVEPLELQ